MYVIINVTKNGTISSSELSWLDIIYTEFFTHSPETNMLLAGPSRYNEWDDEIIEDLHRKAQKKNKSDKER